MKNILIILFISINVFANDLYTDYILDLINEKHKTKTEIKEILISTDRTLTSNMLKGLYYDHKENKIEEAKKYYDEIMMKIPNKLRNKSESLYMADYLVREKRYKEVLNIIDIDYCETLFNNKKEKKCYIYLEESKRNLGIETNREQKGLEKISKGYNF